MFHVAGTSECTNCRTLIPNCAECDAEGKACLKCDEDSVLVVDWKTTDGVAHRYYRCRECSAQWHGACLECNATGCTKCLPGYWKAHVLGAPCMKAWF